MNSVNDGAGGVPYAQATEAVKQDNRARQTASTRAGLYAALALLGVSFGGPAFSQDSRPLPAIVSFVYKDAFDAFILPKMKQLYNVDVKVSAYLSAEALTRAIAQKDKPQTAVFMLDEGPWQQGSTMGLWDNLDPKTISNLKDVPPKFQSPSGDGVAVMTTLLGILYDEASLKQNGVAIPQSLSSLWNPQFASRLAIPLFSSTYAYGLLYAVDQDQKGERKSFDAGFKRLSKIRENVRTFPGPTAQLIQLFQQKEIWAGWGAYFTAAQASKAGVPISWIAPSEGAVSVASYAAVPKGVSNKEDAMHLIDLVLSPDFQKYIAEHNFLSPVNPKTEFSTDAANFPTQGQVESAIVPNWKTYNEERVKLNERWQREVAN